MKFSEIIAKYKYILIALALVVVIAGASVLYNSLSDEYKSEGFAEIPGGGSESPPEDETSGGDSEEKPSADVGEENTTDDGEEENSEPESDDHDHGDEVGDHDHEDGEESRGPTVYDYDFSVLDFGGNTVKLSDYVGKPIVLNFWATWCGYCKQEMPDFDRAAKDFSDVTFLMVNATSTGSETLTKAKRYIEENGFEFSVLYDTSGDAISKFGISSYPTTFFIDSDGVIRLYASGALNYDILVSALGEMKNFE